MNRMMKPVSVLSIALSATVALSACGSTPKSTDNGKAAGGSTSAAPVTVSVMTNFFGAAPPSADGDVQKLIEKATNTKLNISWVSANNYTDKLNVTLASGEIPDLIYINDPFSSVFRTAVKQGAFWDITPYIKDYPNLTKEISDTAWQLTKMEDGKDYGIPRPRPSEGDSFFVLRKDWLDKLNMQVPTTADQLYSVMQAFKDKDPDGDNKADTFGFTGYVNTQDLGSLGSFEGMFTGANGRWKDQNGTLTYVDFLPEEKQALEYMAKAYKDGLINPDFASLKVSQAADLYKAGKAGIIVDKTGTQKNYTDTMQKNDPSLNDLNAFYPVTSLNNYNPKGPGFSGIMAIPKKVPEAKMKQILAMVNTWMNPDVFAYQKWGIEGRDYTVKDGQKVLNTDQYTSEGIDNFNQIVYVSDPYASTSKDYFSQASQDLYKKVQDARAKTSVADVSIGLYSPTAQTYLPEILKGAVDLKTKIILGTQPISAWDSYVAQMQKDAHLTQIIKEMNDAYKARNKAK